MLRPRPTELTDGDLASALASGAAADHEPLAAHARLVMESWRDPGLRARLIADPVQVMADRGIALPAGIAVRVVLAAEGDLHLAIPPAITGASEIAESIISSFTNLTKVITALSYLAGLGFSIGAIIKLKHHKDRPPIPIGTPVALAFTAAALLFVPAAAAAGKL